MQPEMITAKGKAEGQKTVLGVSPTYDELDKTGIDYSEEQFNACLLYTSRCV